MMKKQFRLLNLCLILSFASTEIILAQSSYVDYLYNSSPSLSASRDLAGQVDGWFQDMDQAVADYKRKYPNGNPQAEARGRAYLSGMQQAYQIQEKASQERQKEALRRRYQDVYNKAKSWRDYYWSYGYYKEARKMQRVMDEYDPSQI